MKNKYCVGVTWGAAASILACLVLLCVPAMSVAGASDSRPEADRASAPLVRGAGYGQPEGARRVRALQRRLRALGNRPGPVDGLYGPLTEAAVEGLQRDSGLSVDGIVGPRTRRVLNAKRPPLAPGAGYGQPGGSPRVRDVQRRLRALGQRPGPVDGRYGPRTRAAIERFQDTAGQPSSGVLSPATAVALARADSDQPAQRPASQAAASGPDERPGRAEGSRPAGGSDQRGTRTLAAGDRAEETDGAESTSPLLWAVLALSLGAIGGLFAGWLIGRRRKPEPSGVASGPVQPGPMPTGGTEAAKPTARSTVRPTPEPGGRRDGVPALGYASAGVADGQELHNQIAAIHRACAQRGLALDGVITDFVQGKDTGQERPGLQYVLQRLAAGEASCLVVTELGRLGRSAPEVDDVVDWLRRREARLVAVGNGLDTTAGTGGKANTLVSLPGPRPTGNANNTSAGLARRDVPALKRRIRAMRASGMTLQAIANSLNSEHVPTLRGGKMWRPSGVQAAAGYSRPGHGASESHNGGERDADGSIEETRERSRRSASGSGQGAAR